MKKPRKTPIHCPPDWLHELELPIQRAIFHYELARRTPAGRVQKWPRWEEVNSHVQLALRRSLRTKPRLPISFEPAIHYHALTYRFPYASGGDPEGLPVYFDLRHPIDVLKKHFEWVILELRTAHKIKEHPKAAPQTQDVPWNWLRILDSKKQLNATERSIKTRSLAKGQSFVEAVARCFEDPAKVLLELEKGQEIGPRLFT